VTHLVPYLIIIIIIIIMIIMIIIIIIISFQEEHPGFDFSGAQINGTVPVAKEFMGGLKHSSSTR
jgi:hypothetical protein